MSDRTWYVAGRIGSGTKTHIGEAYYEPDVRYLTNFRTFCGRGGLTRYGAQSLILGSLLRQSHVSIDCKMCSAALLMRGHI